MVGNITVEPRIEYYLQVSGGGLWGVNRGIWVTCVKCGTMSELQVDGRRPDNDDMGRISDTAARRHFIDAGWRVNSIHGPTTCPSCLAQIATNTA